MTDGRDLIEPVRAFLGAPRCRCIVHDQGDYLRSYADHWTRVAAPSV